jgi:hypothetical protein
MTRAEYQKAYRLKNLARLKEQKKAYHLKNKVKFNKKSRNWWKENKLRLWFTGLNKRYGLTKDEIYDLILTQDSRCSICGKMLMRATAKLDHCHKTGKVRGFLCSQCNVGLGMFKENKRTLAKAVAYLKQHDACKDS